eukprot:scaffold24930_cov69-Phaeocystis_antarctica.AAC.2
MEVEPEPFSWSMALLIGLSSAASPVRRVASEANVTTATRLRSSPKSKPLTMALAKLFMAPTEFEHEDDVDLHGASCRRACRRGAFAFGRAVELARRVGQALVAVGGDAILAADGHVLPGADGRRWLAYGRQLRGADAVQHAEGGHPLEQMGAVELGERQLLLVLRALAVPEGADVGGESRLLLGRAVAVLEGHAVGRGRLVVHRVACQQQGSCSQDRLAVSQCRSGGQCASGWQYRRGWQCRIGWQCSPGSSWQRRGGGRQAVHGGQRSSARSAGRQRAPEATRGSEATRARQRVAPDVEA